MDLTNINLNLLVTLKVLLKECHVSRSATKLNLSQPAMSKQLAQLRDLFSDQLLIRTGNHLIPTPKALELQEQLEHILQNVNQLFVSSEFTPATLTRTFTIAATDYVAQYIFPVAIRKTLVQAPEVKINLLTWNQSSLNKLASGNIDLGSCIVRELPANISSKQIDHDNFVCLMRSDHPLSKQKILTIEDYVSYPHAVITVGEDKEKVIDKKLSSLGYSRKIQLRVPFYPPALEVVSITDLILTVPDHIADHVSKQFNLVKKNLPFQTDKFDYSLIWNKRFQNDPAHQWLRDIFFKELQNSEYGH